MLKVLFFIETLCGGGAEKVLRDLVNHMDQTKFDITVQTVWPCNASEYLSPGIRYKSMYSSETRINRFRYRAEAASGLAYLLHIKDDYDIECAYLEMGPTKIMSSSTNTNAKKLAWVHCDLLKAVSDPLKFAKKAAAWYAKFDRIVCVSQGIKESFDSLFNGRFPSVVHTNVIDAEAIHKKASEEAPGFQQSGEPVVMAVGRLSAPKNYIRLLKAHKSIIEEGVPHRLWIIGEGPERPKMERFIADNSLEATVELTGLKTNPYAYMSRADIIACSSSYEGFSTVITEAVILGKPVITTDCYGMREILGNSEFGLITANNDESFSEGLKEMLVNENLRDRYAKLAAKRGKDFSVAELTRNTELFLLNTARE